MNATLKRARQFAIAAVICLGVALAAGLVARLCGASPDPRVEFPPPYYPMFLGFFVAVMLAGVAACLLIAGVVEPLLRRGHMAAEQGASPNGGPGKQAGNSEVTEGPIENGMTSAQAKTPTEPGSSTAPRSRRWASMRLFGVGVAGAICVTLIWLLNQPEPRIQELAFTPAGSDVEAKELVQRMLRVNEPWLKPKPISASFFLHRSYHNYSLFHGYRQTEQNLGPYSVQPGCKPAFRVGSTVRTPLHEMLNQPTNYSVKMVGSAQWKGRSVVGVDVAFGNPAGCQVGLGGQGANYSLAGGPVESVRMLIDPGTAVPVLLRTSARLNIPGNPLFESWWEFGPVFFKLDEGLVPQAFDWRDNRNKIQEHQQFQILNGAWVFDQGRAVIHSGSGIRPRGLVGVVSELFVRLNNGRSEQTLRLTNFSLTTGVSVNGAAQSIIPAKKEVKP